MKLVGMLDSPYVRRAAVCLDLLGLRFEHEAVSVFRDFERFQRINPVVKVPTLVLDDGGILMDSTLILQYAESNLAGASPLWSRDAARRQLQYQTVSYATAACDKLVQLVYETQLRPPSAQHEPWMKRVRSQMQAAFAALELLLREHAWLKDAGEPDHASVWSAIIWRCTRTLIPAELSEADYPTLVTLSRNFETLPVFRRYPPDGPGVPGLDPG